MWWSKQKEKEKIKQTASEESKKSQPCKYFLNGNCKNVSTGCRIIVYMCITKYRSAIFGDYTNSFRGVARIFRGGFLAVVRKAHAKKLMTMPTFRPRPLINDRHFQQEFARFSRFWRRKAQRRRSRLSFRRL